MQGLCEHKALAAFGQGEKENTAFSPCSIVRHQAGHVFLRKLFAPCQGAVLDAALPRPATPVGELVFNKSGDAAGLALSVYQIKGGKFVETNYSVTLD